MTTMHVSDDPQGQQDRQPVPGGQDEVEDRDHLDNLQDADTLADLSDPGIDSGDGGDVSGMDDQSDGDRQLTTDSDAIDGGLNDSDLGAEAAGMTSTQDSDTEEREGYAGLGPDTAQTGGDATGDQATGLMGLRG
jgi:hypothetical protein